MSQYEGEIKGVRGDEVVFKLDRPFDIEEAHRLSKGAAPRAHIQVIDDRAMTMDQNNMIHGLFRDIALYTGFPAEYAKELMKLAFSGYKGIDDFSMKKFGISQVFAGEFIEYILEFCFQNQIPFKYERFHLGSDITRVLFLYIKYKQCFICGEHKTAQFAHYEAVGMGRNRNKIDHSKHRFMCLCAVHHQEQHTIGLKEFLKKYIIVPIKLTPEQVAEFGIGKNMHKEEVKKD